MNELSIIFHSRRVTSNPDNRYRVLVNLQRSDRPRHWNPLCMNCGTVIVTLMNEDIIGANDFFDPDNVENHGVGRHCKGTMPDGLPCPYSYFFQLQ